MCNIDNHIIGSGIGAGNFLEFHFAGSSEDDSLSFHKGNSFERPLHRVDGIDPRSTGSQPSLKYSLIFTQ
jgi:hypothetical protein